MADTPRTVRVTVHASPSAEDLRTMIRKLVQERTPRSVLGPPPSFHCTLRGCPHHRPSALRRLWWRVRRG
ncbi:hypothetical protein [Streptomyces sp. NPDC058084]|uniref:hypothetical protein n=1 Tax=Streptomyces sp. NPDC058084 TaxID=3346333 RepID=UPI0036EF11CA